MLGSLDNVLLGMLFCSGGNLIHATIPLSRELSDSQEAVSALQDKSQESFVILLTHFCPALFPYWFQATAKLLIEQKLYLKPISPL